MQRMHEAGAQPVAADRAPCERRETGKPSRTQTATASNDIPRAVYVNQSGRFWRGLRFALIFDVALVALIIGACYLVSFLFSRPLVAVLFVSVTFLAVVWTLARADA